MMLIKMAQYFLEHSHFFFSWSHRLRPKKLHASVAVPAAPVRVPSQKPLAPNVASITNDKGENQMILEAVHRSPGICVTAEENPRKPHPGDHLMKGLCDQSSPQMGCVSKDYWKVYLSSSENTCASGLYDIAKHAYSGLMEESTWTVK